LPKPGQSSHASAPPDASAELARLRERIDEIDREILGRLNERARVVREVGELKRGSGTPVYEPQRERAIVERLAEENPGPFPDAGLAPVFREIISATRSLEQMLRVAYLGPEGTYAHLAASDLFGRQAELAGVPTIGDVFGAVERGAAHLGVVPVENTTEGIVTQTYDALAETDVALCGEFRLPISACLLSRSGRLDDVERVASHPQPLAQCRGWLDRHLQGVPRVETASTAAAARLAAEDGSIAAIGSAIAAEVYGLTVVEASIEDRRDNTTRFLVIGRDAPAPTGEDLTMAVFTLRKDEAGGLHRLLEPLAAEGINLTSIQIRPMKGKPWEYLFFVDLEGHAREERVARALTAAAGAANSYRVLGSFPRAGGAR